MVGPITFLLRADPAAIQQAEATLEELMRPMGVTKLMVVWPSITDREAGFLRRNNDRN